MRKSDAHILTVDQFSYINDDRFFVILPDDSGAAPPSIGKLVKDGASVDHYGTHYGTQRPPLPRRRLLPKDAEAWTLHIRWLDMGES